MVSPNSKDDPRADFFRNSVGCVSADLQNQSKGVETSRYSIQCYFFALSVVHAQRLKTTFLQGCYGFTLLLSLSSTCLMPYPTDQVVSTFSPTKSPLNAQCKRTWVIDFHYRKSPKGNKVVFLVNISYCHTDLSVVPSYVLKVSLSFTFCTWFLGRSSRLLPLDIYDYSIPRRPGSTQNYSRLVP